MLKLLKRNIRRRRRRIEVEAMRVALVLPFWRTELLFPKVDRAALAFYPIRLCSHHLGGIAVLGVYQIVLAISGGVALEKPRFEGRA